MLYSIYLSWSAVHQPHPNQEHHPVSLLGWKYLVFKNRGFQSHSTNSYSFSRPIVSNNRYTFLHNYLYSFLHSIYFSSFIILCLNDIKYLILRQEIFLLDLCMASSIDELKKHTSALFNARLFSIPDVCKS